MSALQGWNVCVLPWVSQFFHLLHYTWQDFARCTFRFSNLVRGSGDWAHLTEVIHVEELQVREQKVDMLIGLSFIVHHFPLHSCHPWENCSWCFWTRVASVHADHEFSQSNCWLFSFLVFLALPFCPFLLRSSCCLSWTLEWQRNGTDNLTLTSKMLHKAYQAYVLPMEGQNNYFISCCKALNSNHTKHKFR